MKKFVILLAAAFLIISCSFDLDKPGPGNATIKNTSSTFDVTYKIGDMQEETILAGETKNFGRPAYAYMKYYEPTKRVSLKVEYPHDNDMVCTFTEHKSYSVRVNNTIGEEATLKADGWMDEMASILPGNDDDVNHNGTIYTRSPKFSVTTQSGFPAEAVFNFDENTDTFLVLVRWSS